MKLNGSLFSASITTLLAAFAVSCGNYSAPSKGGSGGAGGSGNETSTGGSTGTSGSGGGSSCATGSLMCGGSCVDVQSDSANCGMCGQACAKNQACQSGTCACTAGRTMCSASCVDTTSDPANCGACGTACAAGQVCSLGMCAAACATAPTALTACSGACVDTKTNSDNCGACGTACTNGQTCKGGTCSSPAMCDLLAAAGHPCVAAHSTVRSLSSTYTGPLYQLCKGSFVAGPDSCTSGMTLDIGTVAGGYADAAAQDAFCAGSMCTISIIYDQSPQKNDLRPAPGGGPTGKTTPDNPADATALKTTINGHPAYGILIHGGTGSVGYRLLVAKGIATKDDPESMYMVSSQHDLKNLCCFDYGNAEIDAHDDGNGTMEAVNVSLGVVWGSGVNGGPWVMADLENGLYAGWERNDWANISTNTPVTFDFITGVLVGDVAAKNGGKGRFALYGGDATTGVLKTMYDGIRPEKVGYVPMQKQGSIILGTGGDNSNFGGGRFYEGAMTNGTWSLAEVNAVQANIVAAGYGK